MNIVHIHQDYPDGRPYPFTKAVANLIASCEKQDAHIKHTVVSVNRTSNPFNMATQSFTQGVSIVFWAIPLPFIYALTMRISAFYIYQKIKHLKIDLFHGHKLTSEGVLTYLIAKKTNKPYVLSVRGGSDMHNVKRLSVHKRLFKQVYNQAQKVFWVSAWAKNSLKEALTINETQGLKDALLPNICHIDVDFLYQPAALRQGYITAISYHQYKRKGLVELIETIALLHQQNTSIELNIYGSGDKQYQAEIKNIIAKYNANSCVHLKGQVSQAELLTAMSHSKGFLLPAVNETFGMAYIEALSVGCPILYVENTGIDGYFDNVDIGEKISSLSVEQLMQSIDKIDKNNELFCENLYKAQQANFLTTFNAEKIANDYLDTLNKSHK